MSRTTAREVAMMMHFSNLLGGEDTPEHVCEKAELLGTLDEEDLLYVNQMLDGVGAHTEQIDEFVSRYSKDWMIDRIARVDLSILRIAIYEMLYRKDIPPVVSINEAINLSKQFSNADAKRFINGILDRLKDQIGRDARKTQDE